MASFDVQPDLVGGEDRYLIPPRQARRRRAAYDQARSRHHHPSLKPGFERLCLTCADYLKALGLQPTRGQVNRWLNRSGPCGRCAARCSVETQL